MCRKVCAHKDMVDNDGWFFDSTWENEFPLRFYSGLKKAEIEEIGVENMKTSRRMQRSYLNGLVVVG
jgi:hypothetical protein